MSGISGVKQKASLQVNKKASNKQRIKGQLELQSMVWPGLVFLLIFAYSPLYGVIIAFKDYDLFRGVFHSPWVGLEHFREFFVDSSLINVLRNTLFINLMSLFISFPAPIIFALLLNELTRKKLRGIFQTLSYLPHFVSWAVFGGLVISVLSPTNGIVNLILTNLGLISEPVNFIGKANSFWLIYVFSDLIKDLGWGAILYIAAIAGVDQEMYEAATIDGANRFQKILYITLPGIMGTIVIMLIFKISAILNTGFEQVLVLQNPLNLDTSETLDTYVYKIGLQQMLYSYSTAVGLAKSVIALILLIGANYASRKVSGNGLF